MSTDFERVNERIGTRMVAITSWYDPITESWHASAPSYSHIAAMNHNSPSPSRSRKAAVDWMVGQISRHLATQSGASQQAAP